MSNETSEDGRIIAIGDIHGCDTALADMLDWIAPTSDDHLVFLGDYCDRGPRTPAVIDTLIGLRNELRVTCILGNHDEMMLGARDGMSTTGMWTQFGGDATLRAYVPDGEKLNLKHIPDAHWAFLESCVALFQTDTHIFVHAGVAPDRPLDEQDKRTLRWAKLRSAEPHPSGKTVVCGHTSQKSGMPRTWGHTMCIDSRVYASTGFLTAYDVTTGRMWQTSERGECRELRVEDLVVEEDGCAVEVPAAPREAAPTTASSSTARSAHATRKGVNHENNEDCVLADDACGLYVVADGVGRYKGADVASRLVCETTAEVLADGLSVPPAEIQECLRKLVQRLAKRLHGEGNREKKFREMAAAVTVMVLAGDLAWFVHVGDTRAYRMRNGVLEQLTADHTLAWEQYELGAIAKDEIRAHPNQRLHTRSLTARKPFVVADVFDTEVAPGDGYLLCSDGLNKALGDDDLERLLAEPESLDANCDRLVAAALDADASDDISVIRILL